MKWINITAFTILVILGFIFIYDYESVDSYFENYEQASRDGAIPLDGWIPQFLPKSARKINERHNIDTNETWVSFSFDQADSLYLTAICSSVTKQDVKFPREDRTKTISWWMRGASEKVSNSVPRYFQCDEISFLVVSQIDHKAYFWRLSH